MSNQEETPTESEAYSGFEKLYTCLPLKNWRVGEFQFTDGQLSIRDEQQAEEFEELINHKKFPVIDRNRIKTLDLAAAEELVKNITPAATNGMDQGISPALQQLKTAIPKVGTDNIGNKDNTGNK